MEKFYIANFYRFTENLMSDLPALANQTTELAEKSQIFGQLILAPEGVNTTFSSTSEENIQKFLKGLAEIYPFTEGVTPQRFESAQKPHDWFDVKMRTEIVTSGDRKRVDNKTIYSHDLTPQEFHQKLQEKPRVIDTRNWYETQVGKFKDAVLPPIAHFNQFPEWLKQQDIPRDEEVLIYCTGGIRCEKALYTFLDQGFTNVKKLQGGITNYLKEFPHQEYEGDCLVFDQRISLNQELESVKEAYFYCPQCGQPSPQNIKCLHLPTPPAPHERKRES